MIDLHTHILPDVDDGAANEQMALAMLRQASADGVEAVVLTPHLFGQRSKLTDVAALIEKQMAFCSFLTERKLPLTVFGGAELFITEQLVDQLQEHRRWLTINNSSYCLLEFPDQFVYPGTTSILAHLQKNGFIPIIAHPERNDEVQAEPELAYEWVMAGALLQVNIGSLRGDFGPLAQLCARKLFSCKLIHVVASDAHDTILRPAKLSGLQEWSPTVDSVWLKALIDSNPAAIVANRGLPEMFPPLHPRRRATLWQKLWSKIGFL